MDDSQIVYITENQSVYHTRYSCSHLQLSIEMVSTGVLADIRNQSGSRYGQCGTCHAIDIEVLDYVYITQTGGSYHISLECSGLKRTITSVSLDTLIGKGVCQRCGS